MTSKCFLKWLIAGLLAIAAPAYAIKCIDGVVCGVPTTEKVVALTFDDGPHPTFTPALLKLLDKYHVKATFFMVGKLIEKYPQVAKAVAKAGHTIANHTYDHPYNIERLTSVEIAQEIDKCEATIERVTGQRPHLFRPPRGLVNATVLMVAADKDHKTILWTVCADHHDALTPALMAKRVLGQIVPGGIVLAHDGTQGIRWKDVAATKIIIESLTKQGYRFVTIPELLQAKPPAEKEAKLHRGPS